MNKFGIFMNFWENTWGADHLKYIEKAAKIGFDVLEFQAQPLLEMEKSRMDELKAAAAYHNIELTYSLGLDKKYDISSTDETTRKNGVKYLSDIMKCVEYMGGKIISGVSYAGWGVPDNTDFDREELTHNSVNCMRNLIKQAEASGITYGIEAVNRFEGVIVNTAQEAVNYVNMVDSPNAGVLLDTYHMNIEENNMGDAIRTAGDKLIGLHTGENNRTAPGRGHIDWDEIFKALKDVNFKGRIVSEPFVVKGGEVGRDIYVWRNLVDEVSETKLDSEAAYLLDFEKAMAMKWGL